MQEQIDLIVETALAELSGLDEAGLDQIMILPNFDTRFDVIERVATDVMPAFN